MHAVHVKQYKALNYYYYYYYYYYRHLTLYATYLLNTVDNTEQEYKELQ